MEITIPWNSTTIIMILLVSSAIYMLMWFIKKTLRTAKPAVLKEPWFRGYVLTPLPIVEGISLRLFIGAFCGMLTVVIRNVIKKRVGIELPEMSLVETTPLSIPKASVPPKIPKLPEEKNGGSDKS